MIALRIGIRDQWRSAVGLRGASTGSIGASPDDELIARTAAGEKDAYAELWRRHYAAGVRAARAISTSIEAEDLVQEAFTRIYGSLRSGRGPRQTFRSYLYATIRNTAATWGSRKSHEVTSDGFEDLAGALEGSDLHDTAADNRVDASFALTAFRSLPDRWQEVLWYLEVEALKPAAAAEMLGISAHATSQLAVRARLGLRDAWVSAHVLRTDPGTECNWVADRLGGYMREASSAREHARIEHHLAGCENCRKAAHEAREVVSRLRTVALPLVLGTSGATALLASMQGGATAASASAPVTAAAAPAMPHAVVALSIPARLAAVAGWKWAAVVAVMSAGITGAILLGLGATDARPEAAPKPTAAPTAAPDPIDAPAPSPAPEPEKEKEPAPTKDPVAEPETTDPPPPEPPAESPPDPKPEPDPEPAPAPAVWNTSRTLQTDGSYSITVMLGGRQGAAAVALLDDVEVARAEGATPQLTFSLTAEQYESGNLSFALVTDRRLGVKTETRTPTAWCEPAASGVGQKISL